MTISSWSHHGEVLVFAPIQWSATPDPMLGNLHGVTEKTLACKSAGAAAIEMERVNGPILLVAATDDEMWSSVRMSDRLMQQLEHARSAHGHELLEVDGGHEPVARHVDRVEAFLRHQVPRRPGCEAASHQGRIPCLDRTFGGPCASFMRSVEQVLYESIL